MTERTSLTDADLDRIEENLKYVTPGPWMIMSDYEDPVVYVEADIDGGMFVCGLDANRPDDACFIAAAREDVPALIAEVRRLRAAQTTTLVACSRCGHGHRARHMVALGDERLCVECAGVEMGRLRKRVGRYGSSFLEALLSDDDEKSMFWHVLDPKLKEGLRAALHVRAADAPGGDGEVG